MDILYFAISSLAGLFYIISNHYLETLPISNQPSTLKDSLFELTHGLNVYFHDCHTNPARKVNWMRWILILISIQYDCIVLYTGYTVLITGYRPIINAFMIILALRQSLLFVSRISPHQHMLWFDPGFPSLTIHYTCVNDYFFSGHMAAVTLLAQYWYYINYTPWMFYIIIELGCITFSTLIIAKAHYLIDIYAGIITSIAIFRLVCLPCIT